MKIEDNFYKDITNKTSDAIVAIDINKCIIFLNHSAEILFGQKLYDIVGKHLNTIIPDRFHKKHDADIAEFLNTDQDSRYMGDRKSYVVGLHADGHEIKLGASIVRVRNGSGYVYAAILRDISWRIELLDDLSEQARLDPLTGQLNRRSFLEIAANECERANRHGTSLACLFFDIDHFKALNDRFGHSSGDIILRSFAELVRNDLRTIDCFCRSGGEEFVALLPETDLESAIIVAERIRRTVEDQTIALPDTGTARLTVSIGVSHATGPGIDISEQIRQADEALYKAKQEGRNRVKASIAAEREQIPDR